MTSRREYVTYIPGNCNVILASPHGGCDVLDNAPSRENGLYEKTFDWTPTSGSPRIKQSNVVVFADGYTRPITDLLSRRIEEISGNRPHIIHMNIHRRYVDVNRSKDEGTGGHPVAEAAWDAFHNTVKQVRDSLQGNGIFFDIHGQRHAHGLVELGYRVQKSDLNSHNFSLCDTSVRSLASRLKVEVNLAELIWGMNSFGGMLQRQGIRCVPSPEYKTPDNLNYYRGGYNTEAYGSRNGGTVDAIQLELPQWSRNADNAPVMVEALAETIVEYIEMYY